MSKASAFLKTATIILAGALFASGMSTAIADDGEARDLARKGVADLILERVILSE